MSLIGGMLEGLRMGIDLLRSLLLVSIPSLLLQSVVFVGLSATVPLKSSMMFVLVWKLPVVSSRSVLKRRTVACMANWCGLVADLTWSYGGKSVDIQKERPESVYEGKAGDQSGVNS